MIKNLFKNKIRNWLRNTVRDIIRDEIHDTLREELTNFQQQFFIDFEKIVRSIPDDTSVKRKTKQTAGFIYISLGVGGDLDGAYKIGRSIDPKGRQRGIKNHYRIDDVLLLLSIYTPNMQELEKYFNELYTQYKVIPEREWFHLPKEQLEHYLELLSNMQEVTVDIATELYQNMFENVL